MTRSYFRGSIGVIICYDVTNADSFRNCVNWFNDARQYSRESATYLMLGNKKDKSISGERQVEFLTASSFAQENESLLFETSAVTNENIEMAFTKLVDTIMHKCQEGDIENGDHSDWSRSNPVNSKTYLTGNRNKTSLLGNG